MRALLALLWREYRELRWSVLAAIGILLAWPLLSLCRGAWLPAADQVCGLLLVSPILLGLFFGMRAAAGERDGHTAAFVTALPVHPATLGGVRIAATAAAVLLPLLCLGALTPMLPTIPRPDAWGRVVRWSSVTGREMVWLSAATGLHLAFTIAACGAGARTEARAAARGLAVIGGIVCLSLLLPSRLTADRLQIFLAHLATPLCSLERPVSPGSMLVLLAVLAVAFAYRYRFAVGTLAGADGRQARAWMPASLRSGSAALALKALGEQWLPLAAAGLAALPAARAVNLWSVPGFFPGGATLDSAIMTFGAIAALSLGIASFAADLDPRINLFWRSRPISPSRWFWTKYAAAVAPLVVVFLLGGAAELTATLRVPTVRYNDQINQVTEMFRRGEMSPESYRWNVAQAATARQAAMSSMNDSIKGVLSGFGMAAVSCLGFLTAGVFAIGLFRRPLVAGILASALIVAVMAASDWFGTNVPWDGTSQVAASMSRNAVFAGGILAASLAGTVAAWWLAIRDIAIYR